ncbi:MAG: VanZ family protein [Flavobacteriales bacterium]|nr:hypothetical protein [Flavobacteriales bacterium]MCC6578073.1 VanZ family protein [Flavobacteriales bacterium]NUQ15646.1 VanZ family protein [Flavobacteriales bacterium]
MLRRLRWALCWALAILVLCLLPGDRLPAWGWFDLLDLDKLVHALLFFGQTVLLASAFLDEGRPASPLAWAVGLSLAYGLGTELLQGLEALGRRTDPVDMLANSIGALTGAWFTALRRRKGRPIVPAFLR